MRTTGGLRILFVTSDTYPPFRPAAQAIFGQELPRRGHRVDWLLQSHGRCNQLRAIASDSGTMFVAPTDDGESRLRRLRKHLLDLVNDCRMIVLARRNRYDIIQVKDKYLSAVLAIAVARLFGARFFFWQAFPYPEAAIYTARQRIARYRLIYWVRGLALRFLLYHVILRAADHVFVQSEQMKRDIAERGIAPERMTAIPGSLSLASVPYVGPSSERPGNGARPVVVYMGTLDRMRHLDFVVRAFEVVLRSCPEARLVFVGKGESSEDEAVLREEANRRGIASSVEFAGFLPMNEAWQQIEKADVCLSPYYPTFILNSTSPTKLIEYMAMGKAVVGNEHPEQCEVLSESGGGLCTAWDEEEFGAAIVRLLRSPALAREMGERGRRYVVARRTNGAMTDLVEGAYWRLARQPTEGATADAASAE